MVENLNDLANLEKDLVNKKKKEEKEAPKKASPFQTKSKFAFKPSFGWGNKLKNVDFKKEILSKINIVSLLWIVLLIICVYSYKTEIFRKIEEMPTLEKNLSIIKGNIEKQDKELASLEEINLDNSTLEIKEELLDRNLPQYHDTLHVEQANTIYEIAKEVWLELESLQKIEVKIDERKIEDFGFELEEKGIENFYEKAWYTKYMLSTVSSEEVILRFKEKIEDKVEFVFDWFGLNQSDWEMKYSFSLKAFYNLKNEQDEPNN